MAPMMTENRDRSHVKVDSVLRLLAVGQHHPNTRICQRVNGVEDGEHCLAGLLLGPPVELPRR